MKSEIQAITPPTDDFLSAPLTEAQKTNCNNPAGVVRVNSDNLNGSFYCPVFKNHVVVVDSQCQQFDCRFAL